ncbi:TrkA C-terminal domain-containing protein [Natrinema sp. DC36]|uniref:TrkA C-terminal domain-containing protein n=1 Tax=Natrinema sp. DC36 TaxID=2878680 RepID=UPI001CEFEA07|nr:TrkA C-terminal domain-containing protein [Natrinema sp. DC36]
MVLAPITEGIFGIYLGLLAAIFPAFIAFSIGFIFKYFTTVTIPGLGVVALGGTLAGVSGGLMGLMDPTLSESWTGISAVLVILMACLWAHSQGDKLAVATPRRLTLKSIRETKLSVDLTERVDSYGQVRIRPIGEIHDIEGYPQLSEDLREQLSNSSWKFPADLSLPELESRLEERLSTDYELAEVNATIDKQGRAQIAAAPTAAGLSRRIPSGKRAVTIQTVLPTGVARGDHVTLQFPDGNVTGPVVSARTTGVEAKSEPAPAEEIDGEEGSVKQIVPKMTTTGGEGAVTIAVSLDDGKRIVRDDFAPMTVNSRGKQREYETIAVLKQHGNRFRKLVVNERGPLAGTTIGASQVRDAYGVAVLAVRRASELIIAPRGATELLAGDELIVVGKPSQLRAFEEATT